jgi:hypothetical protein
MDLIPKYEGMRRVGVMTDATLNRRIAAGVLPTLVDIGLGAKGWLSDEIDAVVVARAGGATDGAVRRLVSWLIVSRPQLLIPELGGAANIARRPALSDVPAGVAAPR